MGHTASGSETAAVVAWREGRLREAGFAPSQARALAMDRRYDLHVLIGLVERGCPPALALRIVAPLEEAGGSP